MARLRRLKSLINGKYYFELRAFEVCNLWADDKATNNTSFFT